MRTHLLVPPLLASLVAVCGGCSSPTPQPPTPDASLAGAQAQATPAPAPATALDPCAVLPLDAVRAVLADAKAGVRDRGDEANGVMLCSWEGAAGRVGLQLYDAPPAAAAREIQERAVGLIDPKNPKAANAVRVEVVQGVGDATLAIAEPVDAARGIRRADAVVTTQKGFHVVTISVPMLATGDRSVAVSKLTALARAAVANL